MTHEQRLEQIGNAIDAVMGAIAAGEAGRIIEFELGGFRQKRKATTEYLDELLDLERKLQGRARGPACTVVPRRPS